MISLKTLCAGRGTSRPACLLLMSLLNGTDLTSLSSSVLIHDSLASLSPLAERRNVKGLHFGVDIAQAAQVYGQASDDESPVWGKNDGDQSPTWGPGEAAGDGNTGDESPRWTNGDAGAAGDESPTWEHSHSHLQELQYHYNKTGAAGDNLPKRPADPTGDDSPRWADADSDTDASPEWSQTDGANSKKPSKSKTLYVSKTGRGVGVQDEKDDDDDDGVTMTNMGMPETTTGTGTFVRGMTPETAAAVKAKMHASQHSRASLRDQVDPTSSLTTCLSHHGNT
jgi:hypothetical protein